MWKVATTALVFGSAAVLAGCSGADGLDEEADDIGVSRAEASLYPSTHLSSIVSQTAGVPTKDSHSVTLGGVEYVMVDENRTDCDENRPMWLSLYKYQSPTYVRKYKFTFSPTITGMLHRKAWAPHVVYYGSNFTTDPWIYIYFSDVTELGGSCADPYAYWTYALTNAKISVMAFKVHDTQPQIWSWTTGAAVNVPQSELYVQPAYIKVLSLSNSTNLGLIDPAVFKATNNQWYLFAAKHRATGTGSKVVYATSLGNPTTWSAAVDLQGKSQSASTYEELDASVLAALNPSFVTLNVVEAPFPINVSGQDWLYWSIGPSDTEHCKAGLAKYGISLVRRGKLSYPTTTTARVIWKNDWAAESFMDNSTPGVPPTGGCNMATHPDVFGSALRFTGFLPNDAHVLGIRKMTRPASW